MYYSNGITKSILQDIKDDFNNKRISDNNNIEECKESSQGFENLGFLVISDKFQSETTCNFLIDATRHENNLLNETKTFSASIEDCVECYHDNINIGTSQPGVPKRKNFRQRTRPSEITSGPAIDLKSYLPQTWLFDLVEIPQNGKIEINQKTSNAITTWYGEAFCISDSHGISVSDRIKFKTDQKYDITINIQRTSKEERNSQ